MPIDYRALLVKYMQHIVREEGVTYVSSMVLLDTCLTEAEQDEMHRISREVMVIMKEWLP